MDGATRITGNGEQFTIVLLGSIPDSFLPNFIKPDCKCDKIDALFGLALTSLECLQSLRFNCGFIANSDIHDTRHMYLQQLKTKQLRELMFYCRCSRSESNKPYEILTAPCMRSVTSLGWNRSMSNTDFTDYIQSLLGLEECLPNLSRLTSAELEVLVPLVSKGRITHLGCRVIDTHLRDALQIHPGTLTHLHLTMVQSLLDHLAKDPSVYINLRHIGGISYREQSVSYLDMGNKFQKLTHSVLACWDS